MKLRFSRKTWYFCLLAAAALNLLNGMAALLGHNLAFLDTVAFGGTGISVLFLAAQKGAPVAEKQRYFLVFVLLMLGYLFGGWMGLLFSALVWPALLAVETGRGAKVRNPDDRGLCSRSSTPGTGAGRGAGRQAEPGPVGKLFVGGAGLYAGLGCTDPV